NFGAIWDQLPELTRNTYRVRSRSADDDAARDHALTLSLEGRTELIDVPLQVVMGKQDRLIPWQDAQKVVDEVGGNAELLLLEDGNHGCANVSYKHRYRSADWMAERLRA
ncbi:MAG TPA: alpha/beta hydrolase, partial [Actinomycetota bacterium]|nr:alpha/beta hydrolase [Actinomycetota bacterium]